MLNCLPKSAQPGAKVGISSDSDPSSALFREGPIEWRTETIQLIQVTVSSREAEFPPDFFTRRGNARRDVDIDDSVQVAWKPDVALP